MVTALAAPAAATTAGSTPDHHRPVLAVPGNQYMYSAAHTGFQPFALINSRNASHLQLDTSFNPGANTKLDSIFAQPIASGNRVYVGDWDGYEYAFRSDGTVAWRTYLGRTVAPNQPSGCMPPMAGVSSTPALVWQVGRSGPRQVMFVGGGGPQNPQQPNGPVYFYAVDAGNGHVLWRHQVGVAPQQYVWSSPVYYRGSVYFGIASFGDCPEVQGHVVKLDAATGRLQADFATAPDPCRAGAVWSSPTVDERTGSLYVTTGNGVETGSITQCSNLTLKHAWSILKLRADDLRLQDEWQVPVSQRDDVHDADFGTTATLFTDSRGRQLVGASNKNGLYYAWDRSHLSAGPVWSRRVAVGGACPQCGQAAISPAGFDGHTLYVGGGIIQSGSQQCGGNVQALDPATGAVRWLHCFPAGPTPPPAVLGAVTVTNSVVVVGSARDLVVLDKRTGRTVYTYRAPEGAAGKPPAYFWGAPEVTLTRIWIGNMAGGLYSLRLAFH